MRNVKYFLLKRYRFILFEIEYLFVSDFDFKIISPKKPAKKNWVPIIIVTNEM